MSIFSNYINFNSLNDAYRHTQMGSNKYKGNAINFSRYDVLHIEDLYGELLNETYQPGAYQTFIVHEPKKRVINAPAYRDKVVQHALHKALRGIYENIYYKHSYACLHGRGPHRCAKKIQHNIRVCKRNHGDAWVIKGDIKKFFYSIDRDVLKKVIAKKIKCIKMRGLCFKVIDSSPEGELGIPLGNVTSQDFGNIYMNELDQYITRYLQCKYYARFMDDFVAVLPNKEKAVEVLQKIRMFTATNLKLELNSKTHIFPYRQGVNSCGYKIFATHMLLRDRSKKGMKRRIAKMDGMLKDGVITIERIQQAVNSWVGHAMHGNSYNLIRKIFLPYKYLNEVVSSLELRSCSKR